MKSHKLFFSLWKLDLKRKNLDFGKNFRLEVVQVKLIVKWFWEKATFKGKNDDERKYQCDKCSRICSNKKDLNSHLLFFHNDGTAFEENVSKNSSKSDLKSKIQKICDSCNLNFENEEKFKEHTETVHNKGSLISKRIWFLSRKISSSIFVTNFLP